MGIQAAPEVKYALIREAFRHENMTFSLLSSTLHCHPGKCCVSIRGKEKAARAITDD